MRIAGREILLPTTMVGSWPRPLWLRGGVLRQSPHEVDFPDMYQRTLYEDAVRLAVKDQDLAGLDIVTDGNQYFEGETPYDKIQMLLVPLRLHGFRGYGPPGEVPGMEQYFRPVVHDRVRWVRPVFGPVLGAVKIATDKPFKININAGPATVATWCEDQWYGDPTALRNDVADAFNHELRWLADHGATAIQLTEQTFIASAGREDWVIEMMNRAAHRVDAHLVWHMCYGNAREFVSLSTMIGFGNGTEPRSTPADSCAGLGDASLPCDSHRTVGNTNPGNATPSPNSATAGSPTRSRATTRTTASTRITTHRLPVTRCARTGGPLPSPATECSCSPPAGPTSTTSTSAPAPTSTTPAG